MREDRIEHLKIIQAVIARMAQNSFALKGWAVVIVAALLSIAAAGSQRALIFIALIPVVAFWLLDGYYLRQERLFRRLYDSARNESGGEDADFSMNTATVSHEVASLIATVGSITLATFYGGLLASIIVVAILL